MRLCHNMSSLGLYNAYKKNVVSNASASEKISSGVKINSAKDNPGKIGQSELMRIQLKSLESAERNVQDGVSMLQTADGALQEVNNVLARIKELTVSEKNGTNSPEDVDTIQSEIYQLRDEIDEISKNTQFNGVKMLGDESVTDNTNPVEKSIVTGSMVGEKMSIPLYNISHSVLGITDARVENGDIDAIDSAIKEISNIRGKYGAKVTVLESTYDSLNEKYTTVQGAESSIRDADVAEEIMEFSRTQVLTTSGIGLIAQSNNLPKDCLQILQSARR